MPRRDSDPKEAVPKDQERALDLNLFVGTGPNAWVRVNQHIRLQRIQPTGALEHAVSLAFKGLFPALGQNTRVFTVEVAHAAREDGGICTPWISYGST